MKRDKIVSVRVRQDLYDKVSFLIEKGTTKYEHLTYTRYYNKLPEKYSGGIKYFHKFSISDLLEIAMLEFIEDCSKGEEKSVTIDSN